MNDLPEGIELLEKRLEALEVRVEALEHPLSARGPHRSQQLPGTASTQVASETLPSAGSILSVLGRAMLGIAGAYVLRAVEESSSLPRLAVASAGIAYAFLWLVWAARTRREPRFASSIYAGTSALILAPMLWELTLRFSVLPAVVAACLLCAYMLVAVGLTWKGDHKPVLRVAGVVSAGLAVALALASHAMLPFIVFLLLFAAIFEFAPTPARMPEIRALVALAADAAIWTLIYVNYVPRSAGEAYQALGRAALLAPGVALFLLFAASVSWKTVLRARPIAVFETVQITIAFLLAAVSIADFGPPGSDMILGSLCLALSAAVGVAAFTIFERAREPRNAAVFAAWTAALLLAGSFLCLPPLLTAVLLGTAAIGATGVGSRTRRLVFELYGMIFLVAAASESGLLSFIASALVGTPPAPPAAGVWLIACSAVLCYAVAVPGKSKAWLPQVLHLGFAAMAAGAAVALLVEGMVRLVALGAQPGAHHIALIRTLTLCTAALALVFGGAHWPRVELTRLGYVALGLVAIKLATEDLHHGHLGYIAASIFVVAVTLIAAPRMARARQKA